MRSSRKWILVAMISTLAGYPLRLESSPNVWYCSNTFIKQIVGTTLSNPSINQNVDEIQSQLEASLLTYFNENSGKWLVSVSKFHRVSGYADAAAVNLQTFCAMNDSTLNVHVVIVKVE